MFSLISHCCKPADQALPSPQRRMGSGIADIVLGVALIIIASLSIHGILPGALTRAPAAVLIAIGAVNLMIGILFTHAGCAEYNTFYQTV